MPRTGAIFGVIEAVTPVIGWALGLAAAKYVVDATPARHSFWVLAATGLVTSIDALAVGVSLALLDVDIIRVAIAIGCATFAMMTFEVMLGRGLGAIGKERRFD